MGVNLLPYEVRDDRSAPTRAVSRINYRSVSPLVHAGQWVRDSSSRPRIGNNVREKDNRVLYECLRGIIDKYVTTIDIFNSCPL